MRKHALSLRIDILRAFSAPRSANGTAQIFPLSPASRSLAIVLTCLCLLLAGSRSAVASDQQPTREIEAAYQFALAKMLADEAAFEKAEEAYRRALELDGSDPYSHIEYAKFQSYLAQISRSRQAQGERLEAAAAAISKALTIAPENLDVLRSYAQIHLQLGEHDPTALTRAREAYEKIRVFAPGDLQMLTSLGQLYLWQRQPAAAVEVLREAANYRPNHRMIYSMLVEALINAGEGREAEAVLEKLIELNPDSPDHRLHLADLLGQRGAHRQAAEVLRAAPADLADSIRLRHALARELHLIGESQEALAIVEALLEQFPERQSLRRLRLAILGGMARYGEAIDALQELIAEADDGGSLQDSLMLSRLLERVGRAAAAVDILEASLATAEASDRPQLTLAVAGIKERHGANDEAIELLSAAFAKAAAEEAILYGQGLSELYQRAGRLDEALDVLRRLSPKLAAGGLQEEALQLRLLRLALMAEEQAWEPLIEEAPALFESPSPEARGAALRLYAEGLVGLGRQDEALELLQRPEHAGDRQMLAKRAEILFASDRKTAAEALLAPLLASGDANDLFLSAQVLQRVERYDLMVSALESLRESQPESIQALFLLGSAFERVGRRQQAIAVFEELLARDPDHAPSLNYLGYMLAERKEELDKALAMIHRAVAIDPDNGAYVDSLGWAYFQLGRYDEARGHLEWAARLIPSDATIFEHLGDLYVRLDDPESARDFYRQAIELGGENLEQIRRKLEALEN